MVLELPTYRLVEGNLTTLLCKAEGYPTPYVTWFDPNGEVLMNASGKAQVSLGNMRQEIVGNYTCIATNTVGRNQRKTSVTLIRKYFCRPRGYSRFYLLALGNDHTNVHVQLDQLIHSSSRSFTLLTCGLFLFLFIYLFIYFAYQSAVCLLLRSLLSNVFVSHEHQIIFLVLITIQLQWLILLLCSLLLHYLAYLTLSFWRFFFHVVTMGLDVLCLAPVAIWFYIYCMFLGN